MSPEEKARYRLDDSLGGSSNVIQQRAIRRIYGDKSADIIEGLKKNPVNSVPLVLRRLKAKDEEWRKSQKSFNKTWKEQNEKYYLKSLDHQGINFKQNDVKFLRSKSILNEIETIYEERHEQADESMIDIPAGPHLVLTYKNREIFKDAANLIIHHVKRQTGIHKEDKTKIKQLMRQFFPDFFSVPRGDLSDDELDKDDDMETEDGNYSPKSAACKNLWSLSMACKSRSRIGKDSSKPPQQEKNNSTDGALPDESYQLMFVNNNWYIFFRLHHILCERLWKLHERAQTLISDELRDQEERKQSTALALRLKPRQNLDVDMCFSSFLDMVKNLLDNNLESNQYEDNLREMFGIQAYLGFTLDKVIQNVVRQLQHIVGDESCTQWTTLHLEETKNKATGGPCATTSQRAAAELAYQKRAEQISDENLFKLIVYKEEGKLTIELLDSDSDVSEEPNGSNKWIAFVRKFCEESMMTEVKDHIKRNPPFLFRLITAYMNRKKLQKEKESEHESALRSIQEEIDESKIDLSRLEDGGAGEAVKGLVGLNAKAKFLERTRQNKMNEQPAQGSVCRFNINSFKMLWVTDVDGNNICQARCLAKAKKSHRHVSQRLNQRFRRWHQSWVSENVAEEQEQKCKNWLLGLVEDSVPTTCIRVDNPLKPPYSTYNRYKPQQKDKT